MSVQNRGTGLLWVSIPATSGARGAADNQVSIPSGSTMDLDFVGTSGGYAPTLSVWGADGASHAGGLILMGGRR